MFVPHAQLLLDGTSDDANPTACRANSRYARGLVEKALGEQLGLTVTGRGCSG